MALSVSNHFFFLLVFVCLLASFSSASLFLILLLSHFNLSFFSPSILSYIFFLSFCLFFIVGYNI